MKGFDFLNQVQITAPEEVKAKRAGGGPRKERIPTNADLRIFKDGGVFPSEALVTRFNLEFTPKDWINQGNGFDIIDSAVFGQYFPNLPQRMLFITATDRNVKGGKLDLFMSTTYYNETEAAEAAMEDDTIKVGDPKSSILEQGAVTYGKKVLLPLLKEVYGVEPNEKGFIDLIIVGANDKPWTLPEGKPNIAYLPKAVTRGEDKGKPDYAKREKPEFWALIPAPVEEVAVPEDGAKVLIEDGAEDQKQLKAESPAVIASALSDL